jgi:hypothetical protein
VKPTPHWRPSLRRWRCCRATPKDERRHSFGVLRLKLVRVDDLRAGICGAHLSRRARRRCIGLVAAPRPLRYARASLRRRNELYIRGHWQCRDTSSRAISRCPQPSCLAPARQFPERHPTNQYRVIATIPLRHVEQTHTRESHAETRAPRAHPASADATHAHQMRPPALSTINQLLRHVSQSRRGCDMAPGCSDRRSRG